MKPLSIVRRRQKVQGYYGSWLPFLLELSATARNLRLGFHRRELSLGDGMSAKALERVAAGSGTC
jgi:hypothetical protein